MFRVFLSVLLALVLAASSGMASGIFTTTPPEGTASQETAQTASPDITPLPEGTGTSGQSGVQGGIGHISSGSSGNQLPSAPTPMPVELTFGPETVVYDGNAHGRELVGANCDGAEGSITALSDTEWQINGYTVMINETINVKIEGGGTDPGTYELNVSFTFANNDPGNYTIEPASASLTIEPLELIIDLGNPEAEYDTFTHGGKISSSYGNGSSAGTPLTADSAMSNVTGDATTVYTLSTGDMLTVKASGAGPDPGQYTLPCSWTFSPDRSTCYNIRVTGGSKSAEELRSGDYIEIVEFSDFQVDEMGGDIAGEIRLGYLHRGGETLIVTGGSVAGNMEDAIKEMTFSKELIQYDRALIPAVTCLKGLRITGVE